ncbi:MAG: cell wall biosynthesis glycosyltransferase [Bryobacterales bacterium]|nr:cell wall biosynthesis glycosyltransferase [Bryobacteraceae bacterium]MDW8129740.1 cell wall biosynthesis glycosyltransferase [Bryobacterales bacterium]
MLSEEARQAIAQVKKADIVVGVPSYNNARTIGHVVRAAQAGLSKYFPQLSAVIINSDGGSKDGTREEVLKASIEDPRLLLLATPLLPVHRLSLPYHGIPGKGSAFRMIFAMARELGARACAVVDADLRSITPEWMDLLLRPVLHVGYDFVAPYYHRHKYDGTITNSIVYPLTRALYGLRVRQPIGGDFGVSGRLLVRYLERKDWESDVARYGIDVWMTTIAIAEGYQVCQSFLGAKLHDAKDPAADLTAMLQQVVGSVFTLMREYEHVWRRVVGSRPVDLFGFRFDVGLDPIPVNLERMRHAFLSGCRELREIWSLALDPKTLEELAAVCRQAENQPRNWRLADDLWVRILLEFACAHRRMPVERGHLLRSLTPLYLGRVASFVMETESMISAEVEERIEQLCLAFEAAKPYLVARWDSAAQAPVASARPAPVEVKT